MIRNSTLGSFPMSKVCTKCNESKLLSDFQKKKKNKAGLRSWCRSCMTAYANSYYHKNIEKQRKVRREYKRNYKNEKRTIREWLLSLYEGVPCMDCNGVFPFYAMDFDHRPEEIKVFGIATKGAYVASSRLMDRVHKEISKCDLICACCHRVRTHVTRDRHEAK